MAHRLRRAPQGPQEAQRPAPLPRGQKCRAPLREDLHPHPRRLHHRLHRPGRHPEYLGKSDIQLGKKETVLDTAKVLGSMFDAIEFRGFKQDHVEQLAEYSGVPVWNGLTDREPPHQMLADS